MNFRKVSIRNRTCCYFDEIIKFEDLHFDNISLDENSQENILIHDISCKTLIGIKPFRIRLNKVDGIIKVYDGTRYQVLFCPEKQDVIYNRIRYLIGLKISITYVFYHNGRNQN